MVGMEAQEKGGALHQPPRWDMDPSNSLLAPSPGARVGASCPHTPQMLQDLHKHDIH